MSFSNDLKINVNKLNANEMLLVLLEIDHPFLTSPVRIVNDNLNFVLDGNEFLAMPFQLDRQDDVRGELPKVRLTVPNVGRGLVKWIDGSGGGKGAKISVFLARRSDPNVIEEALELGIESTTINMQVITFNLVIQNNLVKRAMRYTYDTYRARGLF